MQSIILLHGALGSPLELEPISKALELQGLQTHTVTFSGHGSKAFNTTFGIEAFSSELTAFIEDLKPEKPSVFGYSMGGYVALHYALSNGFCVDKIITLGTRFSWKSEHLHKETALLNASVMLDKAPAFAAQLQQLHGNKWEELLTKTTAMMREITERQFLNDALLKTITNQVLLCKGDKDHMVSFDETVTVYNTLETAQLCVLPGTKHAISSVNVQLLAQLIRRFVTQEGK